VTHPLSTKRKNETTPTSPNTSARPSEKKFKPVQPLHTNNNAITIKNIISNFKNRADKENLNSPISTMSKFPLLVDQFARLYNLSPSELNELLTLKQVSLAIYLRFITTSNPKCHRLVRMENTYVTLKITSITNMKS
jgi:hypothetical protein